MSGAHESLEATAAALFVSNGYRKFAAPWLRRCAVPGGCASVPRYANVRMSGKPTASKRLARWGTVFCIIATAPVTGQSHAQDYQYAIRNGSITITGYIGPGGNVAIPATINGLPVTSIGGAAFTANTNLTAITIPDTVTNIEDPGFVAGAFAECGALTNVSLGTNLVYIGGGSFDGCTGLTRVGIPDSVITIVQFAFAGCHSLSEVKIGKSVTQLGAGIGYAFEYCTSLSSVVIPGSVTNLGDYTFGGCVSLAKVVIENGATVIGAHAFSGTALTNVTLPASVATIGNWAFESCSNLVGVYFKGNAPAVVGFWSDLFLPSNNVTAYYLPGTTGWGRTYAGVPAMLWNPQAQTTDDSFGVRQNQFGFNIAGTPDIPLVIEGTADLGASSWIPVQSCTLTNGLLYFSDPQCVNYSERFYRIRSP